MEWTAANEMEMVALGERFAAGLGAGDVVALTGGLGAGKTHFCKGLVRGLGFAGEVTSPTFSLVHEYRGGRLPVFHFDLYRLKSADELLGIGWDEMLEEPGVTLVEWADLHPTLLPEHARWLRIETLPGGGRLIRA